MSTAAEQTTTNAKNTLPWYKRTFNALGRGFIGFNKTLLGAFNFKNPLAFLVLGLPLMAITAISSFVVFGVATAVVGAAACLTNGIMGGLRDMGKGVWGVIFGKQEVDGKPVSRWASAAFALKGFAKFCLGVIGLGAIVVAAGTGVGAPVIAAAAAIPVIGGALSGGLALGAGITAAAPIVTGITAFAGMGTTAAAAVFGAGAVTVAAAGVAAGSYLADTVDTAMNKSLQKRELSSNNAANNANAKTLTADRVRSNASIADTVKSTSTPTAIAIATAAAVNSAVTSNVRPAPTIAQNASGRLSRSDSLEGAITASAITSSVTPKSPLSLTVKQNQNQNIPQAPSIQTQKSAVGQSPTPPPIPSRPANIPRNLTNSPSRMDNKHIKEKSSTRERSGSDAKPLAEQLAAAKAKHASLRQSASGTTVSAQPDKEKLETLNSGNTSATQPITPQATTLAVSAKIQANSNTTSQTVTSELVSELQPPKKPPKITPRKR